MIFLEMILNKIVALDEEAKQKITEIKEKEENIETYISEEIEKEKEKIDAKFLYKRKNLEIKFQVL
mgnify:CR=1 FL=1